MITEGCTSASKSSNGSNANPCSSSTSLTAKIAVPEEQAIVDELVVYPNPVTDYVNIITGVTSESIKISVYNEIGQTVLKQNLEGNSSSEIYLDVSKFKAGLLYIGVEQNGSTIFYKIIKK